MNYKKLASDVKKYREKNLLTRQEFCKVCNISAPVLRKVENGGQTSVLTLSKIYKLIYKEKSK